eukprot:179857-Rhodomonas_salina.3
MESYEEEMDRLAKQDAKNRGYKDLEPILRQYRDQKRHPDFGCSRELDSGLVVGDELDLWRTGRTKSDRIFLDLECTATLTEACCRGMAETTLSRHFGRTRWRLALLSSVGGHVLLGGQDDPMVQHNERRKKTAEPKMRKNRPGLVDHTFRRNPVLFPSRRPAVKTHLTDYGTLDSDSADSTTFDGVFTKKVADLVSQGGS